MSVNRNNRSGFNNIFKSNGCVFINIPCKYDTLAQSQQGLMVYLCIFVLLGHNLMNVVRNSYRPCSDFDCFDQQSVPGTSPFCLPASCKSSNANTHIKQSSPGDIGPTFPIVFHHLRPSNWHLCLCKFYRIDKYVTQETPLQDP